MAALAGFAFGLSRPEAMIERTYTQAFERLEVSRGGDSRPADRVGFDRSHVHLSRLPANVPIGPSLAVGDRITLDHRSGSAAAYEVVEVRPLPVAAAQAVSTTSSPRLLLVTAAAVDGARGGTFRFVVDADATSAPMPILANHQAL